MFMYYCFVVGKYSNIFLQSNIFQLFFRIKSRKIGTKRLFHH
ncbi:hypothetical protein BACCOP_01700 [Phocaeicola coprocola DSM 17136]|uniref:Uncharacterized protein n=1 Tax=Phocaeicola coprocola DSM 17136 TaxID=470145 RepID=B3JII8_9BACT|nr:hypothetical protein BACCOP_01700 [Phocaeicola coprocola DSM 17136]